MSYTEEFRLVLTKSGLCLQFQAKEQKDLFFSDMVQAGLAELFTKEEGNHTYFLAFQEGKNTGWFISEHGRVGIIFPSEQNKFYFKERIGLLNENIMNMGPGYDEQIHFNDKNLPAIQGKELVTVRTVNMPVVPTTETNHNSLRR